MHCATALITACVYGNKATVSLLIQSGASINYQDKVRIILCDNGCMLLLWNKTASWQLGFTPLHYAIKNHHEVIAEILINAGADITMHVRHLFIIYYYNNIAIKILILIMLLFVRMRNSVILPWTGHV